MYFKLCDSQGAVDIESIIWRNSLALWLPTKLTQSLLVSVHLTKPFQMFFKVLKTARFSRMVVRRMEV